MVVGVCACMRVYMDVCYMDVCYMDVCYMDVCYMAVCTFLTLQLMESMDGGRPVAVSDDVIEKLPRVSITKEQRGECPLWCLLPVLCSVVM